MRCTPPQEQIDATQWFQNGDHPDDRVGENDPDPTAAGMTFIRREGAVVRYYRRPDDDGDRPCHLCGRRMHKHGWIDEEQGRPVCPGDWIVTLSGRHYPVKPDLHQAWMVLA